MRLVRSGSICALGRLISNKMRLLIIVASLCSLAYAQFPVFPDVPGVPPKPWTGPIADHQIGIHPADTPEVAAAKAQHLNAYRDVLSVLPELPPEERYIEHGIPLQRHEQINIVHVQPIETPLIPRIQTPNVIVQDSTPVEPTVFAEEIPRSPIGEVPEVHAARVAHLKAVEEARAALPSL